MLKNLKFPLLSVIELALWVPLLVGFGGLVSFLASKPIESLDLNGKSLPSSWEAAVYNHGRYWEGYSLHQHPLAFAVVLLLFFGAMASLYQVHKAQIWQRNAAEPNQAKAHKFAQLLVMATLGVVSFFVLSEYLSGVAPA